MALLAGKQLHFLLFPLMSQSHIIPLTHLAKLLALRGVTVTLIMTPVNATRYKHVVDRAIKDNLKIQILTLPFPTQETGLPEGCENLDGLTSSDLVVRFFKACGLLQKPLEELMETLEPRPSCIVSTTVLWWTRLVAVKFNIPRYVFHTVSCFTLLCGFNLKASKVHETVESDTEPFVVPGMPHEIALTRSQLPAAVRHRDMQENGNLMKESERLSQGGIVNSFEELEPGYLEGYMKVMGKIYCVGPVALSNREPPSDRADEHHCMEWLDLMKPSSVVYACFGSLCRISPAQLAEIGFGLEASNRPFIWVIRAQDHTSEVEKWLAEQDFEERVKGRGLVIRGWAPQVLILSHRAVGGFLTHCGWNSTMEGVCSGLPMITWPMSAEQFYNEKLVVQVLRIGVRVGVEATMKAEEEEKTGVMANKDDVKKAVDELMDEGEEGEDRRKRARDYGDMAKNALEEGGSSYLNLTKLMQDVIQFTSP